MKSASRTGGLVYSTDAGRMCPDCRQPVAECTCRQARPRPAGDGTALRSLAAEPVEEQAFESELLAALLQEGPQQSRHIRQHKVCKGQLGLDQVAGHGLLVAVLPATHVEKVVPGWIDELFWVTTRRSHGLPRRSGGTGMVATVVSEPGAPDRKSVV